MQASLILRVDDQEDWADSVRSRGGIFQPEDWRESHLLLYNESAQTKISYKAWL